MSGLNDGTSQGDRILRLPGGKFIDEIVVRDCTVHIEQMADNCYWIGIDKGAAEVSFNLYTRTAAISFAEQDADGWTWDQDKEHGG